MVKRRIIDLSLPLMNSPYGWFPVCEITYMSQKETAKLRTKTYGFPKDFFSHVDYEMGAQEMVYLHSHASTHLDAPWHFASTSEGKSAKTIDEIPLDWCYGDGVVLDLRHKVPNGLITSDDLQEALKKIEYKLKPYDIVLIRTDISKNFPQIGYLRPAPGMGKEATLWLIEQGIKVMGVEHGWDVPMYLMLEQYRKGGPKEAFWQGHFAGREGEYCHIECLANLHAIPKPFGFKVAVFPIKLKRASGSWVRAVAIVEE